MINLNNFKATFNLNKGIDLIEYINSAMKVTTYKYRDMKEQFDKMLDKYFMILVDCCYADMTKKIKKIEGLGYNIIEKEITGTECYSSVKMIITRN